MRRRATEVNARDIASLDKVLHEPARLSVVACLAVVQQADFVFLQSQTGMTGGNLSSHLRKLEEAGYITIKKSFEDARPKTTLMLTKTGRTALEAYLKTLSALLSAIA
ncbi:MAG: transcriptional regulator [Phycisphaerae bacterium]|jgi:DNA-binding MarR family transcriptional regulator